MELISEAQSRERERVALAYRRRQEKLPPERYALTNLGNLLNHQERERAIVDVVRREGGPAHWRILEIGCGTGFWLREFIRYGAQPQNLTGVELLPERVAEARHRCPAGVTVMQADASALDFPDERFDVVFQSTVFSSVLDPELRRHIAAEMVRVTDRDGFILWYDFFANNPANSDVVGISRKEIESLFPTCRIALRRLTLVPPLARFLGPRLPLLCRFLASARVLSTHYLGIIKKN